MSILQLITILLCALLFGQLTAHFARKKGRPPQLWFLIGALFGLLGLLLVFLIPPKRIKPQVPVLKPLQRNSDSWLKMWYFLDSTHRQNGPLEFPDFIKAWREKRISASSFVWGEGMEHWKKIEELPELLRELEQG
jgi:MFS family permease